jgi:hypothetical protein
MVNRCRVSLTLWLFLVALFGYWVRFDAPIAATLRDGLGGAAYVIFFVVAIAIVTPASSAARIALIVLGTTCALEFLQLWHPVWFEKTRRTFPGRALLGTTFDWTDFPPYFAGALIGWMLVRLNQRIWLYSSMRARRASLRRTLR